MIKVYVGPTCGPCIALKGALDRAGIDYVTIDATTLPEPTKAEWRAKGWTTPVVEHEGGIFSGLHPAKVRTLIDMRR